MSTLVAVERHIHTSQENHWTHGMSIDAGFLSDDGRIALIYCRCDHDPPDALAMSTPTVVYEAVKLVDPGTGRCLVDFVGVLESKRNPVLFASMSHDGRFVILRNTKTGLSKMIDLELDRIIDMGAIHQVSSLRRSDVWTVVSGSRRST